MKGGGRGQQRSALKPFLTLPLSAQALFDIAAQCSDPLLPVSAPVLFDISALDIFDIFFERLTLKIRDFFLKIRKISVSAPTHFAASA